MAGFKTAYLQKEIIITADVVGATKVGDYVKVTPAAGSAPTYLAKSKKSEATHIVAQSDMSLEYGHVPVENRSYAYSNAVAKTVDSAPSAATTTYKKVALFAILDATDMIPDADGNDCVAE